MPADAPHQGLFRFACASIALTVLVVPFVASLSVWSGARDLALNDDYYAWAQTQAIAATAAFAVPHLIGAIFCAMLAPKRSGVMAAGWVLVCSALVLVGGQLAPTLAAAFTLRPERYVDYAPALENLRWISDLAQASSAAALVGLAVGWLMLAFSKARQADGT